MAVVAVVDVVDKTRNPVPSDERCTVNAELDTTTSGPRDESNTARPPAAGLYSVSNRALFVRHSGAINSDGQRRAAQQRQIRRRDAIGRSWQARGGKADTHRTIGDRNGE